jgi:hypothetical protein
MNNFSFVDTLSVYGGLWSFDSGTLQAISNQWAAMPSLHFTWAAWCAIAIAPVLKPISARVAMWLYPLATLFGVIVTANHYWIDGLAGLVVLALGMWCAHRIADRQMLDMNYPITDGGI